MSFEDYLDDITQRRQAEREARDLDYGIENQKETEDEKEQK
jgi:hypothetical protein